jgi:glycosyltransferase involved in cell wall biosynthesis
MTIINMALKGEYMKSQNTDEKKLSVIVPVYNGERYLRECLDSLTRQGFNQSEHEVLVINDGSTDGSDVIINEYCNSFDYMKTIKIINSGISTARNTGIKNSTGKYIAFVDADDLVADHIYLPIITVMEEDHLNGFYYDHTEEFDKLQAIGENIKNEYEKREMESVCTVWKAIYSRDIIENNNIYFNDNIKFYGEDYLFNVFYTYFCHRTHGGVGYLSRKLYYYRQNSDSLMRRLFREKRSGEKTCMEKCYQSYLVGASEMKSFLVKTSPDSDMTDFLKNALCYCILNYLWVGMCLKKNPNETLKIFNQNGLSLKDITVNILEGHTFKIHLKSKIQYMFRYSFLYKMICYFYRIIA